MFESDIHTWFLCVDLRGRLALYDAGRYNVVSTIAYGFPDAAEEETENFVRQFAQALTQPGVFLADGHLLS
ncbi:MAG: hypothetical protein IPK52_18275 [Chloroflexi bacterium]|nr:hypothetical protein [Chloroflexota bacterium]